VAIGFGSYMNDLKLLFEEETGVFIDYSKESKDYLRDTFDIDYVQSDSPAIWIGLYKPFNAVYVELDTPSIIDQLFSFEIADDTGLKSLLVDDDTLAFKRSGFIEWNRQDEDAWVETTINGQSAYWLKITGSQDFTATIQGINLVFADDNDLTSEQPNVSRFTPVGKSSFINYHVAARNEIVQTIRNGGEVKEKTDSNKTNDVSNITQWDILDFGEIRQAAKYLALAKINFDISENTDDKAYQRYKDYMGQYGSAFKLFWKSIDNDDDGVVDDGERLRARSAELVRW
jgi:hypothetical protein